MKTSHGSRSPLAKDKIETALIRSLPKIELHRHLDCSMRWSTMIEIAGDLGIDRNNARENFLVLHPMKDLQAVLKKFLTAQKLLHSEEVLTRLAFEAAEDAFNDGVHIMEFRYAPTFIADGHSHLSFEKIHQALLKGLVMAEKKFPIATGLIGIIQRISPLPTATRVADFIIENKESFIGIDLADNEEGFDPKTFAPLFQKAKSSGLHVTVHSGEAPSPVSANWVQDSVNWLGAERIGHGVQIIKNLEILNWIRDRNIPLEVCPISNRLTQAFDGHENHPIRQLINSGILVTINSDDPGIFGTCLSDDYQVLNQYHDFSVADFERANAIAYKYSFIDERKKQRAWQFANGKGA